MNLVTFNNLRRSCDAGKDLVEFPAIEYDEGLLEDTTYDKPNNEVHMTDVCSGEVHAVAFYNSTEYETPFR